MYVQYASWCGSALEGKIIKKEIGMVAGNKVLFIALSGYSNGIVKKMKEMGLEVDYFNDKPNDGVICKT